MEKCSFRAIPEEREIKGLRLGLKRPRTHSGQGNLDRALTRCDFVWRIIMSIMDSNSLDDLARRLADSVPESLRAFGRDLESNFKSVLQAQLAKLDLVTRQEFDVQIAILERTQAKLTALEARLKDIEAKLSS
jgi:hypothetical protein